MPTRLVGHTVLIGYGRVGTVIGEGLLAVGKPFLVVEDAEDRVAAARAAGIEVVEGNAATPRVLELANVEGARNVVIAIPNAFEAGQATEQCRKHNPQVVIVARAHSDEEEQHLLHLGANTVIMGEREIGLGMLDWVNKDHRTAAALSAADAVEAALVGGMSGPAAVPQAPAAPAAASPIDVPVRAQPPTQIQPPTQMEPPTPPTGGGTLFADVEPPLAPAEADTEIDEVELERAIESMAVQHEDTGPAEPPAEVPSLGEMPDLDTEAATADAAEAPHAAVVVADVPAGPDGMPFKPRQPATTPAMPFNPEVPPGAAPAQKGAAPVVVPEPKEP